jgi:crotonobetainyl-CoA:carnitine CoA-transferase CaiB-like acyl-CoA transferase
MTAILDGIRILDFSRVLAGPFCTMMLADLGAEVVKVERPVLGDETRHWGPPWAGKGDAKQSAYYLSVNRNKYSITLDLKTTEGQQLAHDLALKADVLIENFKVGQMAEYGLDYATLSGVHPSLVYCSLTGYGQTGPYAERPGYDYVIQAQSGLMSITGASDSEPLKVGVAISDVITGLNAANAILAALYHRQQTGQGQHLDIALLDSQLAALVNIASNYLVSGQVPPRLGNAHPNIVPYQTFAGADSKFILAVGNDGQFRALCKVIDKPEWQTDPRFATNPARVQHRAELIALLEPIFQTQPVETWVSACLAEGIPAGPINDVAGALRDPHVQARGMVQKMTLPNGAEFEMVAPAAKFSATPPTIRLAPPELGQDTEFILQSWLGDR